MRSRYMFKAVVLQDGHIDPTTGPRCVIKPTEGPFVGRYLIAHTDEILRAGQPVIFDEIARRATLSESSQAEPEHDRHYDRDGYCDNPARGY